jgi:hypothetical protein
VNILYFPRPVSDNLPFGIVRASETASRVGSLASKFEADSSQQNGTI